MASWLDLKARVDRLGAEAVYLGTPSHWLVSVAKAAAVTPQVLNIKGIGAEHTIIVTTLAHYEDLHRRAAVNANDR